MHLLIDASTFRTAFAYNKLLISGSPIDKSHIQVLWSAPAIPPTESCVGNQLQPGIALVTAAHKA